MSRPEHDDKLLKEVGYEDQNSYCPETLDFQEVLDKKTVYYGPR